MEKGLAAQRSIASGSERGDYCATGTRPGPAGAVEISGAAVQTEPRQAQRSRSTLRLCEARISILSSEGEVKGRAGLSSSQTPYPFPPPDGEAHSISLLVLLNSKPRFELKRKKEGADMELSANAESGM